ncbi:MAG: TIGR03621 family F420-dependent LLM class oxidoreductase [Chloroflexi bacterium]|nr:TIGR03621 family F420-dependent LLM class oxidoreductase [Chloroflexota bacterium]
MRPFRFGLQAARVNEPDRWLELARSAEASGYACFMVPDHLGRLSTFPALMAAAAATSSRMKLATYVLCQDFRPPAVLAQEAGTVQLLTDGRLELGIGAGWNRREYTQTGLTYDSPTVRVARFEEYLEVVKGLLQATAPFSYQGKFFTLDGYAPLPKHAVVPPILVGGGSPRILAIAGRLADIISVSTRASADGRVDMPNIMLAALENKIRCIQSAAADRFEQIELNMTVRELRLTDDRRATARQLLNDWASAPQRYANVEQLSEDDLLESPYLALGSVEQIVEQLEISRERWGFNYLEVSSTDAEAVAPIMARLNGR